MKTIFNYALATTLAVSALTLAVRADTKAKDVANLKGGDLEQIGGTLADESAARDVRSLLAKTVNDATTEGRFQDLVGDLAKVDRDRVGDFKHEKMQELNKAIAQFRADFKTKYSKDLDLQPEHFKDAVVYAGRDKNSATVMLPDWMFNRKADVKHPAAIDPLKPDAKPVPDLAKIGISLTLNVVNEGKMASLWRINIPSETGADQLRSNLIKRIQMFDDQKAVWPVDADAASRAAAFQVLSALNDSALAIDN